MMREQLFSHQKRDNSPYLGWEKGGEAQYGEKKSQFLDIGNLEWVEGEPGDCRVEQFCTWFAEVGPREGENLPESPTPWELEGQEGCGLAETLRLE